VITGEKSQDHYYRRYEDKYGANPPALGAHDPGSNHGALFPATSHEVMQLKTILDSLFEGVLAVDLEGNVIFANSTFLDLWGIPEEVLAQGQENLLKHFVMKQTKDPFTFEQTIKQMEGSYEESCDTVHLRDGRILERISRPLLHQGKLNGRIWLYNDITARVRYEEQLKISSFHDRLTGLYNLNFLDEEMKRLKHSRDYPLTVIVADLDGLKIVNDTMGHDWGDELLKTCARVLKKSLRKSDILSRVGGDEFVALLPRTDKATAETIIERLRARVDKQNRENGLLPLSISVGMATVEQTGASLEEAVKEADHHMYREKEQKGDYARKLIMKALINILKKKDFMKQGHGWRIFEWCKKMVDKLELSPEQNKSLTLLSHVHDLGKASVPDRIIFKKTPLTRDEWEIIFRHPEKGYRIAMHHEYLKGIADLILKHHESWDGSGYPLGLQKEDIPLECRVLAVIEAFEVMTDERPYRKARSRQEALDELRAGKGTRFDPRMVEAFLEVLGEECA